MGIAVALVLSVAPIIGIVGIVICLGLAAYGISLDIIEAHRGKMVIKRLEPAIGLEPTT